MIDVDKRVSDIHINDKFGLWTVLTEPYYIGSNKYVLCKCDSLSDKCIKEKEVRCTSLLNKDSSGCQSCRNHYLKYGKSHTQLYYIWQGIIQRCTNPNHNSYRLYGKRGILVCDNWKTSYETFEEWSIKHGWKGGLQIDRIDPDKGYEENNCRIVTPQQNSWNSRSKGGKSKYKGVFLRQNKNNSVWYVRINKDNISYNIGLFSSEKDAARAYNEKAKELYGEYAYLNKIENDDDESQTV